MSEFDIHGAEPEGGSWASGLVADNTIQPTASSGGYTIQSMNLDLDPKRPVRRYIMLDEHKVWVASAHVELAEINSLWIGSLFVKSEHRNRGLGLHLLQVMEDFAIYTNRQYLSLAVAIQNVAAQRLYQRFGFSDFAESYENYRHYIKTLKHGPEPAAS